VRPLALLALAYSGFAGQALGDADRVMPDRVMPAVFEQGTVFLQLPAPDHSTLRVYSDTGGGVLALSTDAARRLQLSARTTDDEELLRSFGPAVRVTAASDTMRRAWPALGMQQVFVVIPGVVAFAGWPADADGGLGNTWFAGHTWTWDYARGELILRAKEWRPSTTAHPLTVAFKTDAQGRRQFNYPRMSIRIDGVEIPMLFDTGAATVLTPNALKALGGKPSRRAASMMVHSIIEGWHARHPDWRIVEDAQLATHARMILVPSVTIGGIDVSAVWFTERDDDDFHQTLAPVMDAQVQGSLGGNALTDLAVSVNYRASRAWVSKPNPSRH
jgi:hypothetical protein